MKAPFPDSYVQFEDDAVLGPVVVREADGDVVPESSKGFSEAVFVAAVGLGCITALGTVLVWRRNKPAASRLAMFE